MEKKEGTSKMEEEEEEIKLQIKFGGQTIPISLPRESTIAYLKHNLQHQTNVLSRGQKLIFKGKILDDHEALWSYGITNGAKIMLMASQGLHQGEGPITSNAQSRREKILRPVTYFEKPMTKTRIQRWKATGVVGLSESNLKEIPDEVWGCGSSVRVLDLNSNNIRDIPIKIGSLKYLNKFLLNVNEISDDSISWEGLSELKGLEYLSLNQNHLTYLPPSLGALTFLKQLHVAGNKLESLPTEIGLLTQLEILKVNNNRIRAITSCIGDCSALIEVDISSNLLVDLPETFGNLQNLKVLHLSHNGLKSLPSTLFKGCVKLSTLDLHATGITMDMLRQVEGWEAFDERRRLKFQKQLDFRAGGSADFDEGADKN